MPIFRPVRPRWHLEKREKLNTSVQQQRIWFLRRRKNSRIRKIKAWTSSKAFGEGDLLLILRWGEQRRISLLHHVLLTELFRRCTWWPGTTSLTCIQRHFWGKRTMLTTQKCCKLSDLTRPRLVLTKLSGWSGPAGGRYNFQFEVLHLRQPEELQGLQAEGRLLHVQCLWNELHQSGILC